MSMISKLRASALSVILAMTPAAGFAQETYFPSGGELVHSANALFAEAERRPAPRPGAPALDANALAALTGDAVSLSFETSEPDAATGAWRLGYLTLRLGAEEASQTFMAAESALIWGFDTDALAARIRGERLDETIRIFDRIELSGAVFDLTDLTNTIDELATELTDPGARTYYSNARMNVGQIVLAGLTLHPWTHRAEEDEDEGRAAIRLISAIARSFTLDTVLYNDVVSAQTVESDELSGTVIYRYPRNLLKGYDRGRIDGAYQTGVAFSVEYDIDGIAPPGADAAPGHFLLTGTGGYGGWTDLDFSELLIWGERGEMPPITERNLWSFGRYVLDDFGMDLNGNSLFSIDRMEMTADEFAWFLPERISVGYQGLSLELGNFMNFVAELTEDLPVTPNQPSPTEIIGILERTGLSRLSGDGMLDIRWDWASGQTYVESRGTSHGLFSGLTRFDLSLPSYAGLIPAFGEDGRSYDEEAFDEIFEDSFAFSGAEMRLTDVGGLDTIANLLIEVAKSGHVDDPTLAAFADSTPLGVRMFASGMLSLSASAITAEFPQARPWIASLSKFLSEGGTFAVKLAPPTPLNAKTLDKLSGPGDLPPQEMIDLLGLSITHTPAAPQ